MRETVTTARAGCFDDTDLLDRIKQDGGLAGTDETAPETAPAPCGGA